MDDPLLQFFKTPLSADGTAPAVELSFEALANELVALLPRNPERTVMLRKLLESKDAALRAIAFKGNSPP